MGEIRHFVNPDVQEGKVRELMEHPVILNVNPNLTKFNCCPQVSNLNKAKNMYHDKNKEYERCAEAVRIAEQAAELGAAGEGKVDKRKRLEEEALAKTMDYKAVYMQGPIV